MEPDLSRGHDPQNANLWVIQRSNHCYPHPLGTRGFWSDLELSAFEEWS
jgi:hypothetical protein